MHDLCWILPCQRIDWNPVTWSVCLRSSALQSYPRLLFPHPAPCTVLSWCLGRWWWAGQWCQDGHCSRDRGALQAGSCRKEGDPRHFLNSGAAFCYDWKQRLWVHLIHLSAGRDCCSLGLIVIHARPLVQIKMYFHPCNFPAHCWVYLGVYVLSLGYPARKQNG